jgi:hypothetical protein
MDIAADMQSLFTKSAAGSGIETMGAVVIVVSV